MSLPTLPPIPLGEEYPLWNRVSIETCAHCSRRCGFCPQALNRRAPELMDKRVFRAIVTELDDLDFRGVVQMFGVNEPTLDPQLLDRVEMIAGPGRCVFVSTNGDGWKRAPAGNLVEAFKRGVTVINIDAYDTRTLDAYQPAVDSIIAQGIAAWTDAPFRAARRASIHLRDNRVFTQTSKREIHADRNLHDWNEPRIATFLGIERRETRGHCGRPFRHLVIGYDGSVKLCCALSPELAPVVGNVGTGLRAAWDSKAMFEYRAALQCGVRSRACEGCSARSAFSHIVRKVTL